MSPLGGIGKALFLFGIVIAGLGLLLMLSDKIPWLGKLPGDIHIRRDNFSFYFPITTSIILSILLSIVIALFRR